MPSRAPISHRTTSVRVRLDTRSRAAEDRRSSFNSHQPVRPVGGGFFPTSSSYHNRVRLAISDRPAQNDSWNSNERIPNRESAPTNHLTQFSDNRQLRPADPRLLDGHLPSSHPSELKRRLPSTLIFGTFPMAPADDNSKLSLTTFPPRPHPPPGWPPPHLTRAQPAPGGGGKTPTRPRDAAFPHSSREDEEVPPPPDFIPDHPHHRRAPARAHHPFTRTSRPARHTDRRPPTQPPPPIRPTFVAPRRIPFRC